MIKSYLFKQKTIHLIFALSSFFILSCDNNNPKLNENSDGTASKNVTKTIKEVIFVDNGAVVPNPTTRRMVLTLKDKANILLHYAEQNGDGMTQSDVPVGDDDLEEVRDDIDQIAEFAEEGLVIKPGKQPCVGMNSLHVSVIYNTGDTSHIAVSGNVRCDPTLYPSVWALDSVATELYRRRKAN